MKKAKSELFAERINESDFTTLEQARAAQRAHSGIISDQPNGQISLKLFEGGGMTFESAKEAVRWAARTGGILYQGELKEGDEKGMESLERVSGQSVDEMVRLKLPKTPEEYKKEEEGISISEGNNVYGVKREDFLILEEVERGKMIADALTQVGIPHKIVEEIRNHGEGSEYTVYVDPNRVLLAKDVADKVIQRHREMGQVW